MYVTTVTCLLRRPSLEACHLRPAQRQAPKAAAAVAPGLLQRTVQMLC
jgi:hypothetical protein